MQENINNYLEKLYKFCKTDRNYALFINFILFATILVVATLRYDTNDDIGMFLIESGNGSMLSSSEYVVFSNILLAKVLKNLNLIDNRIPWHTLYIIISIFFAYTIIFYALIKRFSLIAATALYLFVFFAYGLDGIIMLQFTKTASSITIAAYMLLLYDYEKETQAIFYLSWRRFLCVALLVFSSLVRFDSFFLISIIIAPIFLFILWKNRLVFMEKIVVVSAAFILIIGAAYFNTKAYKAWGNFMEYNVVRANIVDYDALDKINSQERAEILRQVNWTDLEMNSIKSWIFCDKDIYSYDKLKTVYDFTRTKMFSGSNLAMNMKAVFNDSGIKYWDYFFVVCALLVILLVSFNKRETAAYIVVVNTLLYILLFTIGIIYKIPPPRVLSGMFLATIFFSLLTTQKLKIPNSIKPIYITLFFALLISYKSYSGIYLLTKKNKMGLKQYQVLSNWMKENSSKYIYLSKMGGTMNEGIPVFSNAHHLNKVRIIALGTLQNSPAMDSMLVKCGINDGKLLKHLGDNRFVLMHRDFDKDTLLPKNESLDILQQMIAKHYGIYGHFHQLKSFHVHSYTSRAIQFRIDSIQSPTLAAQKNISQ